MNEKSSMIGAACGGNAAETREFGKWARVKITERIKYLGIFTIREGTIGRLFNIDKDNADYFLRSRPWLDVRFDKFPNVPFFLPVGNLELC